MVRTGRRHEPRKPPGTIWEVPEPLWQRIEPILKQFWPKKPTGRRPANWRQVLNGIIFRMRTGCQWEQLPHRFGPESAVHDRFQRWSEGGICEKIWEVLIVECEELRGVEWKWQAADGALGKARLGDCVGPNPTDRGKDGTKRSLIVEGQGGPLGVVVAGANVNDHKLLEATVEAIVVERPAPEQVEQHLCPDRGYDNEASHEVVEKHGYVGHVRPIGGDRRAARSPGRRKPRRWVVERTIGWLNRCRAIPARYDKKAKNYLGLIQLACSLFWYRRLQRLGAT